MDLRTQSCFTWTVAVFSSSPGTSFIHDNMILIKVSISRTKEHRDFFSVTRIVERFPCLGKNPLTQKYTGPKTTRNGATGIHCLVPWHVPMLGNMRFISSSAAQMRLWDVVDKLSVGLARGWWLVVVVYGIESSLPSKVWGVFFDFLLKVFKITYITIAFDFPRNTMCFTVTLFLF